MFVPLEHGGAHNRREAKRAEKKGVQIKIAHPLLAQSPAKSSKKQVKSAKEQKSQEKRG